jgi:hypothetical protein
MIMKYEKAKNKLSLERFLSVTGLFLLVALLSACIPNEYQGKFQDGRTGATLQLSATKAVFKTPEGVTLTANRSPMNIKDVIAAKEGLYTQDNVIDKNLMEVYWIRPDASSVQKAEGLEWYNTEVVHMRLQKDLHDKVQEVDVIYSKQGTVMVDTTTNALQIGWPAGTDLLELRRVGN